jgi:hypothetical protein
MEFDMLHQTKCVMEDINKDVLVFGEFQAFLKDDPNKGSAVDVKVRRAPLVQAQLADYPLLITACTETPP